MNDVGRQPAASASGVHKTYGAREVLTGLDLQVPAGGVTALLGPSGCGKTTLLRLLAGFDRLDAGQISLGGHLVDGPGTFVPARRRQVGYVPQEGGLFTHLSVAGNIGFGVPRSHRKQRTAQMLDLIGLAGLADRRPDELSGGQQQRVALARALAVQPQIVLLDEPFSALDAGLRAQVRSDVLGLLRSTGTTALLVTHDQEEALSVADQVAVLDGGRIVQAGTPEQLYAAPVSARVARFLGSGTLLPAVRLDPTTVRCALGVLRTTDAGADGRGDGVVLVHSEQLLVDAGNRGVPAVVTTRAFYGHDAVVTVRLDAAETCELTARCQGTTTLAVGAPVAVSVAGPVVFLPGLDRDELAHVAGVAE